MRTDALESEASAFATREEWLAAAAERLASWVPGLEELPRVSVGFAASAPHKTLGFCTHKVCAEDGRAQIYISPTIKDPLDRQGILPTMLHELCHAALPDGTGHKAPFKRLAADVGLVGPATGTEADEALLEKLRPIAEALGPYPHAVISLEARKKQSTRMCKCECGTCGYVCRTTKKWLLAAGTPLCPCNSVPMLCEDNEEEEEE